MQREFNIFGPVHPDYHYHVERAAVKAALYKKIDRQRYFTLNAGRQTGKTTIFQELIREYDEQGDIFGVRQKLTRSIQGRVADDITQWLAQAEVTDHNSFGEALLILCEKLSKPGMLIIDEFDAIQKDLAENILAMFREMYTTRFNPGYSVLHSVILVGVQNVPSLLGGTQSPFNIADQYTVPYFTGDEVAALLQEHTDETGQIFEPDVIENIVFHTAGQPFLVNRYHQAAFRDCASPTYD